MIFSHHVSVGQTWTATINTLTDFYQLRVWFAGQPNALSKYHSKPPGFFDQFSLQPNATGDIQFAIWNLFYAFDTCWLRRTFVAE